MENYRKGYGKLGFVFNPICDPTRLGSVTVLNERFCET